MRSRYSAFYLRDVEYLLRSLAPQSRKPDDRSQLEATIGATQWLGLQILSKEKLVAGQSQAWVEFVAFYKDGSNIRQLHEKSEFLLESGHWFYVKGQMLPEVKWGRNQACWCGSGKKNKRCHP